MSVRSALKCFLLYKVKRLCQIIVNQRKADLKLEMCDDYDVVLYTYSTFTMK